jgi:excisionase family DNA binding protein
MEGEKVKVVERLVLPGTEDAIRVTVDEAAATMGLTEAQVRGLIRKRKIPYLMPTPRTYRLLLKDIEAYMKSCYVPAVTKTE